MVSQQEQRILARVLEMLGSGSALSQDMEEYVIGYAVLGRLAAIAQGEAEMAEQDRKIAWAKTFSDVKANSDRKVTNQEAEILADLDVDDLRRDEIRKREKAMKLKATRESVQEAIWAIKSLHRNGG